MPDAVQLSVIIPARNDRVHLERSSTALLAGLRDHAVSADIIVVDNGSLDGTEALCRTRGLRYLRSDRPLTPAAARNAGVAASGADWLAFLDADIVPTDEWFARVAVLVASGAGNLATGWPVLVPQSSHWLATAWERVRMAGGRLPRYINSGNLVVARKLFDLVGGFDGERVAGEDVDFCQRARAVQGRIEFDPELTAYHYGEPKNVREFFRRQLFHSESMRAVLRNVPGSPLNATISAIAAATIAGAIGSGVLWGLGIPQGLLLLLLGPLVLLGGASAKAGSGWKPSMRLAYLWPMIGACVVMLAARTVGTVYRPRSWRT